MNLHHTATWSIEPEGHFWIVTFRTLDGIKEMVFKSEADARHFAYNL
jgi:hypothetical protein